MEKSTIITLLIVVGLSGLALWLFLKDGKPQVGAQPIPGNCGGGVMGSIGKFIKGHVDRKNDAAPVIAGKYLGQDPNQLKGLTDIAGKLDVSQYAEKWIGDKVGGWFCEASLPGWGEVVDTVKDWGGGVHSSATSFGTSQLAAGTVGPVKSLYSAGNNLVNGNFGDAGKDIAKSIYEGPKAAYSATKDLAKAIIPGW